MRGKEGKQGEFGHFLGKAASCHAGVQIVAFWALTAPAEVLKDQGISLCQILQRPLHCARPLLLCRSRLELILGCAAKTAPPAQEIFASILRQTPLGAFGAAASSPLEANLRQIHDQLCRGGKVSPQNSGGWGSRCSSRLCRGAASTIPNRPALPGH